MSRLFSVFVWSMRLRANQTAELAKTDAVMGSLGDWIRVSHSQWFLWTPRDRDGVVAALKPLRLVEGDQIIVVAVQPEAADGIAPQWIWTWLNDKMTRQLQGLP